MDASELSCREYSRVGADTRAWRAEAIRKVEADFNRSADTHLVRLDLPRYSCTYYNDAWLAERCVDWQPAAERIRAMFE